MSMADEQSNSVTPRRSEHDLVKVYPLGKMGVFLGYTGLSTSYRWREDSVLLECRRIDYGEIRKPFGYD